MDTKDFIKARKPSVQDGEPFDYQGKRPDQVESSYKIFFYCLVAAVITLIIALICQ